ncbi:MAG: hypothetical protein J1F35_05210 [Erysipelotrichales bacterium]|nr:hypothetical protein [Erysipelotrichales bacterium]
MKYFKYSLLIFLCVISFYVSDKLLLYVENASPLMQAINDVEDFDEYAPVNATIDGNTIIPGKKGRTINKRETYLKMNDFGAFNNTFFVYDYESPEVSLDDNLDKVIIKGNDDKKISLLVDTNKYDEFFLENKIKTTKLISNKDNITDDENISYINANLDKDLFYDLNYYLKRKKENNKICLVGKSNIEVCKTLKYYLVEPNLNMYHSNVVMVKTKLEGGSIIYIHDDVSLSELKVIVQEINYKNLEIVSLSELIKE